ncbi:murein hydrolase activator EnvC family protein [Plantibacter sp. RU18]|uniref:murein hydrolase activator EnvC family protein n=1 Tax=Plantibacter sp. RU18 TaxID=3158143 RepID=UPI002C8F19E9|nr:M23 family metallopeptidase [Gemmatimonadaceae bacterium]
MQIIRAARGRITTRHGEDIGRPFLHVGIDIGHGDKTPADLEVLAPADGTVTASGWYGSYGYRVLIDHAGGWWSLLAHLKDGTAPRTGTAVAIGRPIAVMGDTGTQFVHLHQELHQPDGTAVDPLTHLITSLEGITMPKILSVPRGTIAFVSETHGYTYNHPGDFSLAANRLVYGEIPNLTEDIVTTLVGEANHRGDLLADKVAKRVGR